MTKILRKFFPRVELREGDKETAWVAGTSGQNSLFRIWTFDGLPNRTGVMAQELYEFRWNWLWRSIFGVVGAALWLVVSMLLIPELWFLASLTGMAAFVLGPQMHFMQRRKELMSQEIETQVAAQFYGENAAAYRRKDVGQVARRDLGGIVTYPWFRDWTEEQIYQAMVARSTKAKKWISRNADFLKQVYGA